jgi:C-terminal processing protease CtpA/Prc
LLSGDRIVKVNDETVAGVKINQDSLVARLRGKSGFYC